MAGFFTEAAAILTSGMQGSANEANLVLQIGIMAKP